jgi:hypothetical protein
MSEVAVEELLASLSACLTEVSPNYALLSEDGEEYEAL